MKIKIYSHAMDLFDRKDITEEQTVLLENTGLLDAADEVNMMLHFDENNFKWLKDRWNNKTNVKYQFFNESYKEWYEATTMHQIQEDCHATDENYYVLCITHKGISHKAEGHQNWRKYMQYFTIEKWKECVAKLDEGYDIVGAAYLNNQPTPFFPGTFFWAKASYLRKCRRLLTPPENNFKPQFENQPHHRYDLECWHGSGEPKWFEMHQGLSDRWYLPPSTYRNDLNSTWIYNTNT
jgi:hypothetical protein